MEWNRSQYITTTSEDNLNIFIKSLSYMGGNLKINLQVSTHIITFATLIAVIINGILSQ